MIEKPDFPLQITDGAQQNIIDCVWRIIEISNRYGYRSEDPLQAMESFVTSIAAVFRLGGYVTPEDDLSLYGASFIHYGMIFHRRKKDDDDIAGEWSVHS